MYKVKLTEFVNKMNLKSLLPDIDTDSIMIEQSAVNRLALQLAGFFEHFDSERIQVIGNVEAAYMKQLAPESIPPLCEKIFSFNIPCLVFCRGLEPSLEMLDTAEKNGVPIFTTEMTTSDFIANSFIFIGHFGRVTTSVKCKKNIHILRVMVKRGKASNIRIFLLRLCKKHFIKMQKFFLG